MVKIYKENQCARVTYQKAPILSGSRKYDFRYQLKFSKPVILLTTRNHGILEYIFEMLLVKTENMGPYECFVWLICAISPPRRQNLLCNEATTLRYFISVFTCIATNQGNTT